MEQKSAMRRKLEDQLAALRTGAPDVSMDVCADENEMASMVSEANFKLAMNDRRVEAIREIERALRRIDDPEYGLCANCGEEIGAGRLEALPTASLCIECQNDQEKEEAA